MLLTSPLRMPIIVKTADFLSGTGKIEDECCNKGLRMSILKVTALNLNLYRFFSFRRLILLGASDLDKFKVLLSHLTIIHCFLTQFNLRIEFLSKPCNVFAVLWKKKRGV